MDFGNQRDIAAPFAGGQGRPHPGDSGAHDQDRVLRHRFPLGLAFALRRLCCGDATAGRRQRQSAVSPLLPRLH